MAEPGELAPSRWPVYQFGERLVVWWDLEYLITWFGIRFQWEPTRVLAQPMGALWRLVDSTMAGEETQARAAADRKREQEAQAIRNQMMGKR